jgi:Domain of unknown function (DUF6265)
MTNKNLGQLEWLIGQWEGIHGSGIYHEEWEKINNNEFKGKAYLVKKGEIPNPEKLKLHCDDEGIYYTADVSHNPNPVLFEMTSFDKNQFVFENPLHDFPQKITYEKMDNDTLLAIVEATKNSKTKRIDYKLKRLS